LKTEKQLIRDCSYEIITGMEDNVDKEELFKTLVKKYNDDILMKALEVVDQFQHWQAKRHGVDLDDFDKQFAGAERNKTIRTQNMKCFQPEMNFFSGSMVRVKDEKEFGK